MSSAKTVFIFLLFLPAILALNQEGHSLLSWLSAFNSSSSAGHFSSWNPAHRDPCKWEFITCTTTGFVSEIKIASINLPTKFPTQILSFGFLKVLVLTNGNLTGEIPPAIGNLSSLITLDLSFNALTGSIPPKIGRLSQLQQLSLSSNLIHGEIPKEIGNCSKLQQLELFDNLLSGMIPAEIGHLTNLEIFRAGGNLGIVGEIPMQISNCKMLAVFGVADTGISGQIPHTIGELKNLKTLAIYTANLTGLRVIDFSLNFLTGLLPPSFENFSELEELLLSDNSFSGSIPSYIGNFSGLKQLELDNNNFSGEIPPTIGKLKELSLFFAWQNQLTGSIPAELAHCHKLQSLDLSHNFLTGRLDGPIPSGIALLPSLSFLELSDNQLTGAIPPDIGNCTQLEMVDLDRNMIEGIIPVSFVSIAMLNVLDLSMNRISGTIPEDIGKLTSLNKLMLNGNSITGLIPKTLGLCKGLQLLDLSSNKLNGQIPGQIGQLQGLDIMLNLSRNFLTGPIPESFSNLSKLANMDISHNMLTGSLNAISNLNNLVSLNVSCNNFSGVIPNTKFFQGLPSSAFLGNQQLCINRNTCHVSQNQHRMKSIRNLTILIVLSIFMIMIILTATIMLLIRAHGATCRKNDEENGLHWDVVPFQKLTFSVNDVVTGLSDSNIIGKGCSGVVYRVEIPMRQVIAVKKLWPKKSTEISQRDLFSAEVKVLGSIRHKNIVRLLGCCNNGKTRLLLFDYISNGSLAGLLHEKRIFLDWDARYKIILGAAQGLEYLHHDCIPPIIHRDIKANNILVGSHFEAVLADFGLAKHVNSSDSSRDTTVVAGSYGYMAPECGYSLRITEKSDVYSFGIVLLEELRVKHRDFTTILDQQLLSTSGTQTQEMLQVLGVSLLCVNPCPNERPTMKDVAAMLTEIRHENDDFEKPNHHRKAMASNSETSVKAMASNSETSVQCSSFSRSSEPLIKSPFQFQ
nr:LRR receptor-like serine/threonine-protein kinase RCH1 [Ipomoea batatas]